MKVLVATAMYPTVERPAYGSFVRAQVESLRGIGVDVESFVLEGRNHKLMYPRAVPQLRARVGRGDVDVVHAHYSYVGAVASAQREAPVVLTFHGDDLLGTIGSNGRLTPLSRGIVTAGKLVARLVDAVIVQNREMAERLAALSNVHVIPHEVDLDLFKPTARDEARSRLGLDPDRPAVLFASPPDIPVKRFPLAREAVELLRAEEPSVELLVVHRETQERLALYMSAADVLVFPSYQEGSPNIVKQAMACNLPIVATDVGDVAEVIGGAESCYVVPPDAAVFAERLAAVIRRGTRSDGRERVRHLASPVVARRVLAVYEQVLAERRSRRVA